MHKNRKRFHRLSVKFIFGITGILLLILTATLFINSRVMERYYLHRQRENVRQAGETLKEALARGCLLYTSDAADDLLCVDLGGSRINKKKKIELSLIHISRRKTLLQAITNM